MKTQPLQNDHYTYRVSWSEEDQEYVGFCAEFPSLSWLDSSPENALLNIRTTVSEVVADMNKNGEPIPEPINEKHYSGNFMVRVPPEVHRQLALEAAEAGVSINRIVSTKLARNQSQPSEDLKDLKDELLTLGKKLKRIRGTTRSSPRKGISVTRGPKREPR